MKIPAVLMMLSVVSLSLNAQTTKKPASTAKPGSSAAKTSVQKTGATTAALKNAVDSFSYAVGLSMANFYKAQGVKEINSSLLVKAINDVKAGKPMLTEEQANACMMNVMQGINEKKMEAARKEAEPVKKEGQAFLTENKKRSGVVALPSGLQYEIIKEGTGEKPTADARVRVHYQGSLIDGTIFDSSIQRGEPIVFGVGEVIRGWTEALQLMPVGSKWKLFIPSDLAYGDRQAGPLIRPGSTLVFDVELLEIVK
jgi:FKBP-type peptidyl-prolyl cis-trans isomerase FklB